MGYGPSKEILDSWNYLMDNEAFYSNYLQILENISEGIYITDGEPRTLYLNRAYEEISGGERKLFLGKSMLQVKAEGLIDNSASLEVIATGHEVTMNQTLKNGKVGLITSTPIFKDGKISLIVTIVRDVTEIVAMRRQLDERTKSVNKLRFMISEEEEVVVRSAKMKEILTKIDRVSKYDTTILITGETGVGKDVLARYIHKSSARANKNFVDINCSVIPASLIESELFGYEEGAFTGASKRGKKGIFEQADGGIIFLDEIGELPLEMQSKLLKTLQDKKIRRIGGNKDIHVDVQIVAATNHDLRQMLEEKTFREDLYYRLNVVPIFIPPLRQRREDILALVDHFIEKLNGIHNTKKMFDPSVLKILRDYDWPGNIRELKNTVERMFVLSTSPILSIEDLPDDLRNSQTNLFESNEYQGLTLDEATKKLERFLMKEAFDKAGNAKEAAKLLGISASTFVRKRQRHGKL
ncbi:sigma-54 interaction domain-containing protein [Guggenheimella bovis]